MLIESIGNYKANLYKGMEELDVERFGRLLEIMRVILKRNGCAYIIGNGGSAAISNHVAVDWTKVLKLRTRTLNEASLITCFANDYGHENWMAEALLSYTESDDLLVAISSSGNSQNIINAVSVAQERGLQVVTLTGFERSNKLNKLGGLNFWVDSKCYNHIEMIHLQILLMASDILKELK